jgi:uncharacterized membrane protein
MQTAAHGRREANERNARLLGYFSLALGLSEVAASAHVATLIGLKDRSRTRNLLRLLGLRELVSGLSILAKPDAAGPVWSRVAGDAIDLGLLGAAFSNGVKSRTKLGLATTAVSCVTALDAYVAARLSRNGTIQKLVDPIHVVRSVTINRSPEFVYQFWRKLENLPRFMAHLESVTEEDERTSVWRAKGPGGMTVEWRAEITLDQENERLAWRSLEGASVPNRGVVCFKRAPAGRGTELIVELRYDPPGGMLSSALAKLVGEEPGQQVMGDLRRLKQVLETGGVVHSDASIHRGLHAGRPPAQDEAITVLGRSDAP